MIILSLSLAESAHWQASVSLEWSACTDGGRRPDGGHNEVGCVLHEIPPFPGSRQFAGVLQSLCSSVSMHWPYRTVNPAKAQPRWAQTSKRLRKSYDFKQHYETVLPENPGSHHHEWPIGKTSVFFSLFAFSRHTRFSVRWVRQSPQSAVSTGRPSCGHSLNWALSGVSELRRWGMTAGCDLGVEDLCYMGIHLNGNVWVCGGRRGVNSVQFAV